MESAGRSAKPLTKIALQRSTPQGRLLLDYTKFHDTVPEQ
jgi:hypothetical protein